MPSGDSSPSIRMNPGSKRGERVHGDESPDGINAVPTPIVESIKMSVREDLEGSKLHLYWLQG